MNLEEMKKFAAMTEEERAMAIKKAEWAKEADEEFQSKFLAEIFTYSSMDYSTLPAYCTNCQSKVKTPQSFIDEWVEEAAYEEGDE